MSLDPTGDATWTVNAGYGKYMAGLANGIADSGSNGGVPRRPTSTRISGRRSTPTTERDEP